MKLHFLGGADEVGASCTLIEIEDMRRTPRLNSRTFDPFRIVL